MIQISMLNMTPLSEIFMQELATSLDSDKTCIGEMSLSASAREPETKIYLGEATTYKKHFSLSG